MGREMDKKMTTPSLEKILKAKKAEERAIENAEMKMLYSAYVESGLGIEEAILLLKEHANHMDHSADNHNDCCGSQDCCEKKDQDHKSAEDIRQGKKAREGKQKQKQKSNESTENYRPNSPDAEHTKPASPVFF